MLGWSDAVFEMDVAMIESMFYVVGGDSVVGLWWTMINMDDSHWHTKNQPNRVTHDDATVVLNYSPYNDAKYDDLLLLESMCE